MRLTLLAACAALLAASAAPMAKAAHAAGPAPAALPPVDYAQDALWLCRPGRPADACGAAPLDAVRIAPDGSRTPAPFRAAANPKLDCFYVYPTVSKEEGDYASLTVTPEVAHAAASQFARFAGVCRVFAPLYRQVTLPALDRMLQAGAAEHVDAWSPAYADVRAAWRSYLERDNGGRGVVLIGHSQGTIMLQRLLAEQIDGRPAQRLLAAAFLAGDPGLAVAPGADRGGTFKTIPLCRRRGQGGCVYAWGSYTAADASAPRRFGVSPIAGDAAACVSPAAPGGGQAAFTSLLPKPHDGPAADPPWVEVVGGFKGACRSDAQGAVLRVAVTDAPYAARREALLAAVQRTPGWGLHTLDVNLVEGDMLADVAAIAARWPPTP